MPTRILALVASCLLAEALAPGAAARADSPFEVDLAVDLPLIGLGAAGSLLAFVEVPPPACWPECSSAKINALDRMVLGNYSESAHTVATLGVVGLVAAPVVLDLIDGGGSGFAQDMTVYAEALLLTQALTQLTKFAVQRPAPFVYDPDTPESAIRGRDASRSFFSGHTSTAFAASAAYTTTYWLRHPDAPARWAVLGVGAVLSSAIAVLKIEAGYHFWTDVAAGALAGASIGTLVPLLHAASR